MSLERLHDEEMVDITIIGSGPAGLFAAFYAGMRKSTVKVIESMPQLGGQLAAIYPEKYIYDVAGFPQIRAQELVDRLVEQCKRFNPQFFLDEKVLKVEKIGQEYFEITTTRQVHRSRTIIITPGSGAFEPRKLSLAGAEKYEESNLFYFVKDLQKFAGQKVLINGGGDSAVDWANMLQPIADRVTIIHRRNQFRAHETSVEKMRESGVQVLTPREIHSFSGDKRIEKVEIIDRKAGIVEELEVDAVIVNFGFVSSLGPIQEWGLEIKNGKVVVNSRMETNIPGIYAAGDITTYPGKINLIAVGFGEAPIAVNNAKIFIDPQSRLQPSHSSSMKF